MTQDEIDLLVSTPLGKLLEIPSGVYDNNSSSWWIRLLTTNKGWIKVSKQTDGRMTFTLTSGRFQHNPFWGKCKMITLRKEGSLEAYMTSTLSLHIQWGHGKGKLKDLHEALEFAKWVYDKLKAVK